MNDIRLFLKDCLFLLPGIILLSCATYFIPSTNSVILSGWILFAILTTLLMNGYKPSKIKFGDLEIELKEAKKDIDNSLALILPLVSRMAYLNDPSIRGLGGRKYIYELITKVMNNSSYDQPTKSDLVKDGKWYLIKNLFESLQRNPLIEKLSQVGNQDKLQDTLKELYNQIKNSIPTFEYDGWLKN